MNFPITTQMEIKGIDDDSKSEVGIEVASFRDIAQQYDIATGSSEPDKNTIIGSLKNHKT